MDPERISEPEIREIGGEPLEGSGFEAESRAGRFVSNERYAEEGPGR